MDIKNENNDIYNKRDIPWELILFLYFKLKILGGSNAHIPPLEWYVKES